MGFIYSTLLQVQPKERDGVGVGVEGLPDELYSDVKQIFELHVQSFV